MSELPRFCKSKTTATGEGCALSDFGYLNFLLLDRCKSVSGVGGSVLACFAASVSLDMRARNGDLR